MTSDEKVLMDAISSFSTLVGGVQIKFLTNRFVTLVKNEGVVDTGFCQLVKSCPQGYRGCDDCDKQAQARFKVMHTAFMYKCHMNLTEMMHPAFVDGEFVGSFFFGQFHQKGSDIKKNFDKIRPVLNHWKLPLDEAWELYQGIPTFSDKKVNHIRSVLDLFALSSAKSNLIHLEQDPYIDAIREYIDENLTLNISLSDIAAHLHLSPAYVSNLFSKKKNISLFRFIQSRRIEHACFLLKSSNDSINTISQKVGFADQNYFAHVFKDIMGTTASRYRKHYSIYESRDFFLKI